MILIALLAAPALATELVWDGFYRGRGLVYNSLSLTDEDPSAEGTSNLGDHRLLLRPTWRISDHAAIRMDLDVLPLVLWGESSAVYTDPVTGDVLGAAQVDGVATANTNMSALRAWGEGSAEIKGYPIKVSMGRMPMHWGAGILWNDGTDPGSEYGDTIDRFQVSAQIEQVFVMTALDVQQEGFLGVPDDMQAVSFAVGFRNETIGLGLLNNFRWQSAYSYQAYTADLWGMAKLGPIGVELEAAGVFGGGDLDNGANDLSIVGIGLMARGGYEAEKFGFKAELGVATGDPDPTDKDIRTFTFDRDHNVGLFMFEEVMPTLEAGVMTASNAGRDTEQAVMGEGVSNAFYIRPSAHYRFAPSWEVELAWVNAGTAKGAEGYEGSYGNEFDLGVTLAPHPHISLGTTFGLFLPGRVFRAENAVFNQYALGARVVGTVAF